MKKQRKVKTIPDFKNEDEERDFWATHSILDFPGQYRILKGATFPNLKRTKNLTLERFKKPSKAKKTK
jgi:hypothetical protein